MSAGRYYVTATYGQAITGLDVDVTAGDQSIARTVDLRAGILRVSSVLAAGGTPLESDVHYVVYEAAKDADGNRKHVADNYEPRAQIPLSAGRYYITASSSVGKGDSEVTISSGQAHEVQLRLGSQSRR